MAFVFLIVTLVLSSVTQAEYRAFELRITNTATGKSYSVRTTFDHIQYPQYYRVAPEESIEMVSTWMCRGRTDYFKPLCENPQLDRGPAAVPNQNNP